MKAQKKAELPEGSFSLQEFGARFKSYPTEELESLAELLFTEVLDSYTGRGQTPSRLELGERVMIIYPDMASRQIVEAVGIMEKKYRSELQEMNFPFAKR